MKIKIKNYACYKKEQTLNTESIETLVYGLNGTGKTIISDFLYDYSKNNSIADSEKYKNFSLEATDKKKIVVYNQQFIKENFYDKNSQKGIFTLSRESKQIEEKMKELNGNLADKKKDSDKFKEKLDKNQENQKNKKKTTSKIISKAIKENSGLSADDIDFFLEGIKTNSKKLFQKIQEYSKPEQEPSQSLKDLKQTRETISSSKVSELISLKKITENFEQWETQSIFREKITGTNNNPFHSKITNQWENSDWIKSGLSYIQKYKDNCPFCQQKITDEIRKNIENYFDNNYKKKLQQLEKVREQYDLKIKNIPEKTSFSHNQFTKEDSAKFENLYEKFVLNLKENLKKMDFKIENPSKEISLSESKQSIEMLNQFIEQINKKIDEYNEQIRNKEATKSKTKESFFQLMRWKHNSAINSYEEEIEGLKKKEIELQKSKDEKESEIKKIEEEKIRISANSMNMKNTIKRINDYLQGLGFSDLKIVNYDNNQSLRISRESESNNGIFKTLSEGEKMIISFLYFLELCKGKTNKEETEQAKIIVIDDPISSLSQTHVFNIAELIKKELRKKNSNFEILILTHNLYFFHELVRGHKLPKNKSPNEKTINLFRLTKGTVGTEIKEMKKEEIQNEYESYWQVLKDFTNDDKNHHSTKYLLANTMRNILEYFFGFIKNSKSDVLRELNKDFSPFVRYMNRESHSDSINILDGKDINIQQFQENFKEVFKVAGHLKHYENMMKEEVKS